MSKAVQTPKHLPRTGDCYSTAADLVIALARKGKRDALLVHGRPTLQREPFCQYGHAWVEWKGICHSPYPGGFHMVPRALFYEAGKIDPELCHVYTADEVEARMRVFGHYGPWEGVDAVPPVRDGE